MSRNPRRSLPLVAATLTALAALTGCGVGSSSAAQVDGTPILTSDVDLLARITCTDLEHSQAPTGTNTRPVSVIRGQAVQTLVDAVVADRLARQRGTSYDKTQLAQTMAQVDNALPQLPAGDRQPARVLIARLVRAGLEIQAVGRQALVAAGHAHPSARSSVTKGQQLQRAYAKKLDISIDPRYATGASATGDQLSVPVSQFARNGASSSPTQLWTVQLPASQRCG